MIYVLLPGLDGSGALFAPLLNAMGADVATQVLRYPPDRALNYVQLVEFVAAQLPLGECTLIAESFSGPIAVALAAKFSQHSQSERSTTVVSKLVLSCSFIRNPVFWLAAAAPMLDFLPMDNSPKWLIAQQLFNGDPPAELGLALHQAISHVRPHVTRARLKAIAQCDMRATMAQTHQPLLYLQAAQDRIVPSSAWGEIVRARKDVQIVRLQGPHCLLQAQPRVAWQAILAFART